MAAEQARRENVTGESAIDVEKDRVQDVVHPIHGERVDQSEPIPVMVGGMEFSGTPAKSGAAGKGSEAGEGKRGSKVHAGIEDKQRHGGAGGGGSDRREEMGGKEGGEVGRQPPSLEEISILRGMAQQNSAEAIRAAEERYQKAKQAGGS